MVTDIGQAISQHCGRLGQKLVVLPWRSKFFGFAQIYPMQQPPRSELIFNLPPSIGQKYLTFPRPDFCWCSHTVKTAKAARMQQLVKRLRVVRSFQGGLSRGHGVS